MKHKNNFFYLIVTIACTLGGSSFAATPFEVGTATIDITPPIGYRMSGYFHERLSTGTKDPLLAKAIVFSQGDVTAALVICDIVGLAPTVTQTSRQRIADQLDIPIDHVSIAATHSHTGPLYWGALREHFHEATVAAEGSDPPESINYPALLTEKIVEVVQQAKAALMPVTLAAGYGHEDRIAFNRRFLKKDGTVATWIGVNHPDVVRVAGPIDPQVGIIRFDTADGAKPLASLTTYALHLDTTGGTKYSADYPYYLQQDLAKEYGDSFVSLFGSGPCGDINHVNTAEKERNKTDVIGKYLAESVLAAMPSLKPIDYPTLAVKRATVAAPKQFYTPDEIAQAKQDMQRVDDSKFPLAKRVKATTISALQLRPGDEIPLEVYVFRLSSDVAIVTLPGEVFVELGLHIKANSPFDTTLIIELANDAPGYIPTKKAFAEGGYETINSRVTPGSGEKMADTAIELLRELHNDL